MTEDRHRRDAYASTGARISHRQPTHRSRTATRDLAPTGANRSRRPTRRRKGSNAMTLIVACGLIIGFVAICFLLLERNQGRFDPFTTIEAQLRSEAPETFATDNLDSIGRRLVEERLERGHPTWFATARQAHGEQQRQVMAGYWDAAARELAADPEVQSAYRRAEQSFAFRGKWFGTETAPAVQAAPASATPAATGPKPAPAAARPAPQKARPEPEPEIETAPAPQAAPAPVKPIDRLM